MSIEATLTVAGIGSRVSRDDAVGLELVQTLQAPPGVGVLLWEDADALTLAHEMLQLVTPLLVVDCANMRLSPGTWRAFPLRGAARTMAANALSTHGLGMVEALGIARQLGFDQPVEVFGVQPFDIRPGMGLSASMTECLGSLQQALAETVADLQRTVVPA